MADFSIASQIRPMQLPDPLQQYAQFNQLALHQAQLAEVQRATNEQNQMRTLFASGVDRNSPEALRQAYNISLAAGQALEKGQNELKTAGLTQQKLQGDITAQGPALDQARAEAAAKTIAFHRNLLPSVTDQASYDIWRANTLKDSPKLDIPAAYSQDTVNRLMTTADEGLKQHAATLAEERFRARPTVSTVAGMPPMIVNSNTGTFSIAQEAAPGNVPPSAGAPFAVAGAAPAVAGAAPAVAGAAPAAGAAAPAVGAAPTAAPADLASNLLRRFEGFREKPYYDVNAYRTGYGSDTITQPDGTVVKVQPGMQITKEDAERDLSRRLNTEFIPKATAQVGAGNWTALPAPAQAALASVAYNYGSLPSSVVAAVKTGDVNAIADAVQSLKDNPGRRAQEAAVIRGNGLIQSGPTTPSMTMGQQFAVPGSAPGGLNALAPLAGMPSGGFNNLATSAAPPLAAPAVMPVAQQPRPPTTFAEAEAQRQARIVEQKTAETTAIKTAETQVKAKENLPRVLESARVAESVLDQLIGGTKLDAKGNLIKDKNAPYHPGFEASVGQSASKWISKEPFAGTDRADFETLFKQAQGGAFLTAYNILRGAGAITDIEGEKATQAQNAMNLATTEKAFIKAANDYRDIIRRGVGVAKQQASGVVAPADGAKPVPTAAAAAHLKANPHLRQAFDEKYVAGASASILGN